MTTIAIFPRTMKFDTETLRGDDTGIITMSAGYGSPIQVFLPTHVAAALLNAWDDATAQDAAPEPVFASVRRQEQLT